MISFQNRIITSSSRCFRKNFCYLWNSVTDIFILNSVCAFWMCFGGNKFKYEERSKAPSLRSENVTVSGYEKFNEVFFSLFRLTLVDDYDYDVSIL